jgi:hypothetical protein
VSSFVLLFLTLLFDSSMKSKHSKCDNAPKKSYQVKVFPGNIRFLLVLALNSQHLAFCMMKFDASPCADILF